jgi:hypothetical protein
MAIDQGQLRVKLLYNLRHYLQDSLIFVFLFSKQESLNVKECLFRMLKDKLISCIILAVVKHGQELFCVILVALVFKIVKDVGRSNRLKQVLNSLS